MRKPLVIELFAGKCGWGKGFVSEGWRHVGFDIVHEEWHRPIPEGCEMVLQDVLTLDGAQFKDAAAIVASPPCQRFSYMAMPWDLAKREIRWQKWERDSPFGNFTLNDLFDACFRIQREASAAAGRYIPMVVENVKGAQPWVGPARWHHGSFFLWGDVPALMPVIGRARKSSHVPLVETPKGTGATSWFFGNSKHEARNYGVKQEGLSGPAWFDHGAAAVSSKSVSRKAASAAIAEIPFELSSYLARVFRP